MIGDPTGSLAVTYFKSGPWLAARFPLGKRMVISGEVKASLSGFKTVVIKDVNADELCDLIEYGKTVNAEVRFIEYMDVGGATKWSPARVFTRAEMLDVLGRHYGRIHALADDGTAPADRFALQDATTFGIITTSPASALISGAISLPTSTGNSHQPRFHAFTPSSPQSRAYSASFSGTVRGIGPRELETR